MSENQLAGRVIGAAIEVHRALGPGYPEEVYERALCVELGRRHIPFRRQVAIAVRYQGADVGEGRVDLLVAECLVVELKATDGLAAVHVAQARAYLKALRLPVGLLITFDVDVLKKGIKRVIWTR